MRGSVPALRGVDRHAAPALRRRRVERASQRSAFERGGSGRTFRGNGGRGRGYSMVKVVESVSLPDGLVTVSETVLVPGELKKGCHA